MGILKKLSILSMLLFEKLIIKKDEKKPIRLVGTKVIDHEHLRVMRLKIIKSMLADGSIKEPKNFKQWTIPLYLPVERLYCFERNKNINSGGDIVERVSGNTQETIFKRYSHMFKHDEIIVLKALENL